MGVDSRGIERYIQEVYYTLHRFLRLYTRVSPGSRRGILPVWDKIPVLVASITATFEACVFPCGHRFLFIRGFLCCLLLGSLTNWVKLGEWFWALIRFLSILGDPGADSGGKGKTKRAEKNEDVFSLEWIRAPVIFGSTSVRA